MDIYPEQILAVLGLIFFVAYLEMKMRVIARKLAKTTVQSVGVAMILLGGLLLVVSALGYLNQNYAIYTVLLGFLVFILGWFLEQTSLRGKLEIESEKRSYLKRVRKGMTIVDAEKMAKEFLLKEVGGPMKKVGSTKEFKTWKIFFSGPNKKYYMVVIDMDGDILSWESMDKLPPDFPGPY